MIGIPEVDQVLEPAAGWLLGASADWTWKCTLGHNIFLVDDVIRWLWNEMIMWKYYITEIPLVKHTTFNVF